MKKATSVLIVVDMENGFVGSKTEHIVPSVADLIRKWTSLGRPVVFTRFVSLPGGQYERLIGWRRLQSPPETDFHPMIAPLIGSHPIIEKNYYSAFTDQFDKIVAENRWDTIAVCGIATDSCVLKTAVDAFERGLTPQVITDACASHGGPEIHDAALQILRRFIGRDQLKSSQEILGT